MRFSYPVLVADIGGTNVRMAIAPTPGAPLVDLPTKLTVAHRNFAEAVRAAGVWPRTVIACAAGPVVGRSVKLTNAAWDIDGPATAMLLKLEQGILFNDFEAQALSIPSLEPEWLTPIGEGRKGDTGPRLIHGPGTGLGTAALVAAEGKWLAISSEASHSDFAPVTEQEREFWPFIEPVHGRITPEALISGPGLRRLHRARFLARGREMPSYDSAQIISRAVSDPYGEEAESVRAFWRLAGRFAGDMAMAFVASGGVILAGGMLPRMVDLLEAQDFRAAFEDRAPYVEFARKIPVSLLMAKDTVLAGLAAIARQPEAYAIDYAARLWR